MNICSLMNTFCGRLVTGDEKCFLQKYKYANNGLIEMNRLKHNLKSTSIQGKF